MATPTASRPLAKVFYSWQSDLPNSTNRGLILDALERAAKKIRSDDSVAIEPVVDRDTQNVPGSPDIAHTIFQKIDEAVAFVADVSIIGTAGGRPTPNPNVLIEVGYAIKSLGFSRTVLILNTAFGTVESLPFDLKTKRVLTYNLPAESEGKAEERKKLQDTIEAAIRALLAATEIPTPAGPSAVDKIIQSIEARSPAQSTLCTRFMGTIADKVKTLTPKFDPKAMEAWDEEMVGAIAQTLPDVLDFARIADAAATHDSRDAPLAMLRGFGGLFLQYNLPPGVGGHSYLVQFDLAKFVGHELVVTLFAALIRERRWSTVSQLCRELIVIPGADRWEKGAVPYPFASEYLGLLKHRNERLKLNRVSLHADILKERHESEAMSTLSPWLSFQEADLFLYLRSVLEQNGGSDRDSWRPWSAELFGGTPSFLVEAKQKEKAEQLLEPLGVPNIVELRTRLGAAIERLSRMFGGRNHFYEIFEGFQPELIGTR